MQINEEANVLVQNNEGAVKKMYIRCRNTDSDKLIQSKGGGLAVGVAGKAVAAREGSLKEVKFMMTGGQPGN